MSGSRKLLVVSGLGLSIWGMAYGLYYALFEEHQALDQMGLHLTTGFVRAAERNLPGSHAEIQAYAKTAFTYVRRVDVHSHWGGLAMLLIVLGIVFDRVAFEERKRFYLAAALVVGSVIFPLGVILQTVREGILPSGLAVFGSALIIAALSAVALGFARGGQQD